MSSYRLTNLVLPISVVVASAVGLLVLAGTNPWDPLQLIVEGSLGGPPFEAEIGRASCRERV